MIVTGVKGILSGLQPSSLIPLSRCTSQVDQPTEIGIEVAILRD